MLKKALTLAMGVAAVNSAEGASALGRAVARALPSAGVRRMMAAPAAPKLSFSDERFLGHCIQVSSINGPFLDELVRKIRSENSASINTRELLAFMDTIKSYLDTTHAARSYKGFLAKIMKASDSEKFSFFAQMKATCKHLENLAKTPETIRAIANLDQLLVVIKQDIENCKEDLESEASVEDAR